MPRSNNHHEDDYFVDKAGKTLREWLQPAQKLSARGLLSVAIYAEADYVKDLGKLESARLVATDGQRDAVQMTSEMRVRELTELLLAVVSPTRTK